MKPKARELDQLIRDWVFGVGQSDGLLARISELSLTAETTSVIPFARALSVLDSRTHPTKIASRIEQLRSRISSLRDRELQIDDLGNPNNKPQALFDILGDDVAGIQGFDLKQITQARLSGTNHAASARAMLEALGWDRLPQSATDELRLAIEDLEDREQHSAWGLFVDHSQSTGWALGIELVSRPSGQMTLWSEADSDVQEQARIALETVLPGQGWEAKLEWPASYTGESIGLPLYVAGLVISNRIQRHCLTASTGRLSINGQVSGVNGIKAKVEAAKRIGIRRVLVPRENLEEARSAAGEAILIIPVSNVAEVADAFRQSLSSVELGHSGLIRLVRASIPDYGLVIKGESPEGAGHRFTVANSQGAANIWVYTNNRVRSDGPRGSARDAADLLISERLPSEPEQRDTRTFELPTQQLSDQYQVALQELGAANETPHAHEKWRVRLSRGRSTATVVLYNSGKCVLQGSAPAWDEAHDAADSVTKIIGGLSSSSPSRKGARTAPEVDDSEPHIGTDEAGKGDYFGPLVSAAVFVDKESGQKLRKLGVRDSKTIADRRIRELADEIRRMPEVRCAVTPINPRKYNELYESFRREGKNLNSLLAWGHGKSIDTLLNAPANRGMGAKYVVVDQFADKHYIEQRTRRAGIPVHQRHKAEEDIAVAAASVLARDGFLQWLERMSHRAQIDLPKGASPQVILAAKQFVRKWGARWLGEVAKLHFRTTSQVLEGEESNVDQHPSKWASEPSDVQGES